VVDDVTTEAMTYGYDTAGQLTSADRTTGAHPDRSWAYDSVGRRTDACEGDTAIACTGGTLSTYTYDNAGWLTTETVGSDYSVDWVYDEAGRRDTGTVNVSGTGDIETRVYTYDDAGALTDITGTDLAASTQSFHFGYKRTGTGVVYGTESVTGAGVDNVGGVIWDPTGPIAQIAVATLDDGTPVLYGYDRDRKTLIGSNFYRFEADGSTISDPDNSGGAAGFDPYGRPDDTPDHTILGYRSELQYHAAYTIGGTDLTAELIYLRARDYDPQTGTFLTPDPLDGVSGTPTVANGYQYVGNDPINYTDPSGLCRIMDGDFYFEDNKDLCESLRPEGGGPACQVKGPGDLVVPAYDPYWDVQFDNGDCEVPGFTHVVQVCKGWSTACAVSDDIVNFAGGALQWNPMFQIADGLDRAVGGGELDLVRNNGVNPDTWAYRGGVAFSLGVEILVPVTPATRAGQEITVGDNFRAAPFGNRTGHPTGRLPHYHLRRLDDAGTVIPGQGIRRHRPWDTRSLDTSFLDRVF